MLDDTQSAVVRAALGAPATLIVGAPGTGKTTLAVEIALATMRAGTPPAQVLVLAASRRAAAELRDRLATRAAQTVGAPMVRTAASVAFAVLRERAAARDEPAPTLISGPEQDLALAELLSGHLDGDGVQVTLPRSLPVESLGLRGLRHELRDLLMRAAERGLAPADLAELGRRHDRPEWVFAAELYQEYLDVTLLASGAPEAGARFDPAVVVAEAAMALADWDVPTDRPHWSLVVVDDYQEATAATAHLLEVLHAEGARLVLLADPDSAVQTFRGATPGLVGRASAGRSGASGRESAAGGVDVGGRGEFGAQVHVLDTAWRQSAPLRAVTASVTAHIPTVAGALHRGAGPAVARDVQGAGPDAGGTDSAVRVAVLPSAAQEAAFVARELRAAHLVDGVPWDQMAVITRTSGQLAALRRSLVAASVPVSTVGADVPIHAEPAVVPLLMALRVAVAADSEAALDAATGVQLLMSPLGGLDAVAVRRLRRALRIEELAGGGGRSSDALLVEVLSDPVRAATLPPTVRRAVVAIATMIEAGVQALQESTADARTVLWAVWAAAGVAERWQAAAIDGGVAGARADRDLDAVLALFRVAETFAERMPGASVAAFLDYVSAQDLPADSLAARAAGTAAVCLLTPAGAAGRQWDLVVVAGVQDGVWPDLRLRDSLLGAQALVEFLAGRSDDPRGLGPQARRAVLADESRLFAVAVSRARSRLLVTAVDDGDESPSAFCDLVDPSQPDDGPGHEPDDDPSGRRPFTEVGFPVDLRGVVAAARSLVVSAAASDGLRAARSGIPPAEAATSPVAASRDGVAATMPSEAVGAARLLAVLAALGVRQAAVDDWYGVHDVSTREPLAGPEQPVEVSPSKVESVSNCALRWALESAGGTGPDEAAQSLGTLVHAIAQELPAGSWAELRAELDRRWAQLGLREGWVETQTRRRAESMIDRLADYLQQAPAVLVEAPFRLQLGRAVLRGVIDRVEQAGTDSVRIADLKTGRNPVTKRDAESHPQLGAYQLAVAQGALDLPDGTRTAGAQLVYLAKGAAGPTTRAQEPVVVEGDGSSWPRTMVEEAAETMAGSVFSAQESSLCGHCPVSRSCPVRPEGRQVVA